MPQISLVGDGHGGLEDYATLSLWFAAESTVDYGVGNPIEAACLGNCGDLFTLTGTGVNGAVFYTKNFTYDGSDDAPLAYASRVTIAGEISWHDFKFKHPAQWYTGLTLKNLGSAIGSRWILEARVTAVTTALPFTISSGCVSATIENFIIEGIPAISGWVSGYIAKITARNFIICNTDKGFDGYYTTYPHLINGFIFDNLEDVKDNTLGVFTNIATEDLTSPSGLTGYTSAELVDYANHDYRVKSTSPLATLGTNGSFIGAFLESGGGGVIFQPAWAINSNTMIQ